MEFGELQFILTNSSHLYGVDGVFELKSDDCVTKRAIIKLKSHFEMLPFQAGDIDVTIALDGEFRFECTCINLVDDKTIELVVARTAA